MPNFIVDANGNIVPAYDPNMLPSVNGSGTIPGTPPNAAGAMDDFYAGNNGFIMPDGRVPALGQAPAAGAGAETGAGAGAEAIQAATKASMMSRMMPFLAKAGLPLALLTGMGNYNKAMAHPDSTDPNGDQLSQVMQGKVNPNWPPAANSALHLLGGPSIAMNQMGKDMFSGVGDYFTKPQGEPRGNAPQGGPSSDEAVAAARAGLAGGDSQSDTIDTGMTGGVNRPAVPQLAAPVGVDTNALTQWLDKAQPKEMSAEDKLSAVRANIMAGLGKALMDTRNGESTSTTLAHLAGGIGSGAAAGTAGKIEQEQRDRQAQVDYAHMRAGYALDTAKMDANQKNAVAEVAFKNALLKHEDALQEIGTQQPKFMGMQGGIATYQVKDPATGSIQIKTFDTGLLQKQAMAKRLARGLGVPSGGGAADSAISDSYAADMVPANNSFGYYSMIAKELNDKGMLGTVLGVKSPSGNGTMFDQVDNAARTHAQTMPGDEKGKGTAYQQQVIGNAAGILMNYPELVSRAAPYSIWASQLNGYLNPRQ